MKATQKAHEHHEFVCDHFLGIASSNTNLLIADCLQGFQAQASLTLQCLSIYQGESVTYCVTPSTNWGW
jgi:hypothetical protein